MLDTRDQVLKEKIIPLVNVFWLHHSVKESTWELEFEVHANYPDLFSQSSTFVNFEDEFFLSVGGCKVPKIFFSNVIKTCVRCHVYIYIYIPILENKDGF